MPTIHDHIIDRNYGFVVERVRTHPEEARSSNKHGITPLHWLAFDNAPLHVVQAVYEAFPDALHAVNRHGNTPLDVAIQCSSEEVIDFLRAPYKCKPLLSSNFDLACKIKKAQEDINQLLRQNKSLNQEVTELKGSCDRQVNTIFSLRFKLEGNNSLKDDFQIYLMNERQSKEREHIIKRINVAYSA